MRQAKKGNPWNHGMKVHTRRRCQTPDWCTAWWTQTARVNDVTQGDALLHGQGRSPPLAMPLTTRACYERPEAARARAWHVAIRSGLRRKLNPLIEPKLHRRADRASQGQREGQGGTSVPRTQAAVRLHQGALPRAREEHGADHHAVRAGQPVDGAAALDGSVGMRAPEAAAAAPRRASSASRRCANCVETTLVGLAGDAAASAHLKLHFASRCADLP